MTTLPLASIPATEVRSLHSAAAGQEYLISVALPFHYEDRSDLTYPVIYVLDANLFFGLVVDMVRAMNIRVPFCNELPDALIVGIGYPTNGSLAARHAQVMHLRMRDFLPTRDEGAEQFIQDIFPVEDRVASGGAGLFLRFFQDELIPWVEAEYRTAPADRTLLGHSWGGLFALHALFQQPALFQRLVVVSPDLPHGQGMIVTAAERCADTSDPPAARMYLAYGDADLNDYERPYFERFVACLTQGPDVPLKLSYQVFAGGTHCAVVAPAFQAGLVSVFG
jgi:uncharacterized protein